MKSRTLFKARMKSFPKVERDFLVTHSADPTVACTDVLNAVLMMPLA
jgi:hypothetical protein